MTTPAISVVICTRNRAEYLGGALESLLRQSLPGNLFEVVVVDNGSSDRTARVAEQLLGRFVNARYVQEPVLGHSKARNTGWRHARSEIVAYLDDDAVATARWLEQIAHAFQVTQPSPACVGGPVSLVWERVRPSWLGDEIAGYLGWAWRSHAPHTIAYGHWLLGGNIACRRSALEAVGGFDERVGRKGLNLLSMDENLLQHQLFRKGYSLYYDPEILVWHHAHAQRVRQNWFLRRFYWEGRSEAVFSAIVDSPASQPWRNRVWVASKTLWECCRRSPRLLLRSNIATDSAFLTKCRLYERAGYLHGLLLEPAIARLSRH